jgi:hypothetical protein
MAQQGVWRSVDTGEVLGEQALASQFDLAGGRVVRYARFDTLSDALTAARLAETDEVSNS